MSGASGDVQPKPTPIASLDPSAGPDPTQYIRAIVTLVWPYSSSTRQTSLLLAEPDFRLRRRKGQVRVNFSGPTARRVGTSGIGIGDFVTLRLAGSTWITSGTHVSTPGKSVDGELAYRSRLVLRAERGNDSVLDIDVDDSEPSSASSVSAPATPAVDSEGQPPFLEDAPDRNDAWLPPVAIPSSPSESSLLASEPSASAEDDGPVPGKRRKRTLFARRSGEWRYVKDDTGAGSDAARNRIATEDASPVITLDVDLPVQDARSPTASALPRTPQRPRLLPVQSMGLPLVSPLQTSQAELNLDRLAHFTAPVAQKAAPVDGSSLTENRQEPQTLASSPLLHRAQDGSAYAHESFKSVDQAPDDDLSERLFDQFVQSSPVENEQRSVDIARGPSDREETGATSRGPAAVIESVQGSDAQRTVGSEHTPPPSQTQDTDGLALSSPSSHRIDLTLDRSLPLTPARTRSNLDDMLASEPPSSEQADGRADQQPLTESQSVQAQDTSSPPERPSPRKISTDITPGGEQANRQHNDEAHERKTKESTRKAEMPVSPQVPDAISPWFDVRRSTRRRRISKQAAEMNTLDLPSLIPKESKTEAALSASPVEPMSAGPWRSKLAVYQPLSSLQKHIGFADSQGATLIDVFVIAADNTSKPTRSKAGPRDHHVSFKVTDGSLHAAEVEVQCFRPYPESLPSADVGDVVLLRDFAVKTRHHGCFLLSASSSAWHVWKYGGAAKNSDLSDRGPEQECRGAPVELGAEEQGRAVALRKWWLEVQGKKRHPESKS